MFGDVASPNGNESLSGHAFCVHSPTRETFHVTQFQHRSCRLSTLGKRPMTRKHVVSHSCPSAEVRLSISLIRAVPWHVRRRNCPDILQMNRSNGPTRCSSLRSIPPTLLPTRLKSTPQAGSALRTECLVRLCCNARKQMAAPTPCNELRLYSHV